MFLIYRRLYIHIGVKSNTAVLVAAINSILHGCILTPVVNTGDIMVAVTGSKLMLGSNRRSIISLAATKDGVHVNGRFLRHVDSRVANQAFPVTAAIDIMELSSI